MSPDGNTPLSHGEKRGENHGETPHEAQPHAEQPHGHDLGFQLPRPAKLSATRGVAVVLGVLAVGAALFFVGYLPNRRARAALEEGAGAAEHVAPRVDVVVPAVVPSDHPIVLPGSIRPLEETIIYSRANGYLRRWLVDIGDKVTEGQLLAEIETPELDQEIVQSRAQLAQAQAGIAQASANRDFSKTNLERYKILTPQGLTSQQDLDQKRAQAAVDEATVLVAGATAGSQQANVNRLLQLKSFARVLAPFAGTIMSRTIDRGALVTAGNATPMFRLVATDPVRVFVQVPQSVAPSVRADIAAKVLVGEFPNRAFEGKVARASGALDPASRTMSTEVRIPNPKGELLAGMYAEVALTLPSPHKVLELPATVLITDAKGLHVAVITEGNVLRLIPVVVERDTGATVHISSGLTGNELVVKLGSTALVDGTVVDPVR